VLLLVDDEAAVRAVISRFAERHGFEIVACADGREALDVLRTRVPDLALVDVRMPHVGGLDVLKVVRETAPHCQVILMSGFADVDTAVQAIRLGAMDYLRKPLDFDRLSQLFGEVTDALAAAVESRSSTQVPAFQGLIGGSPAMRQVVTSIRRLAPYARTALITGETGTGKELAARAFHAAGRRSRQRFVVVNCSAVVESLFESEVFGHVKGAFTGAVADKAGLFEQAHRGTLFLDEIGELPLAMQAKLLRVLESGELLRVGALQPRHVDVHVIAATNRDLASEVAAGRFRQDLLFRLNMIEIEMPPLRARREDIVDLARAFLAVYAGRTKKAFTGFTPDAEAMLRGAAWPGNVRQLRNAVERASMVADGPLVTRGDLHIGPQTLAVRVSSTRREPEDVAGEPSDTLDAIEREHLARVLAEHGGNKLKAAAALGVSRRALYRLIEKHGFGETIQRRRSG
jgi:two-component system response regulator HydG